MFPWTRTSPRKRKSPKERIVSPSSTVDIGSLNEVEDVEEGVLEQIEEFEVNEVRQVVYVEIATQTDCHADEFEAIVTEVTTKGETIQILQQEINELQSQIKNLQEHIEKLQQRVFSLNRFMSNDKAAHFYTGFENWDAFMIIYRYLKPGQKKYSFKGLSVLGRPPLSGFNSPGETFVFDEFQYLIFSPF